MKIIIGADLVPTKSNYDLFSKGDLLALIDSNLNDILKNADYRVFNLEVPLCDKERRIKKAGPHLIAPTSTIYGIKNIGVNFVNLANNHILDQDLQGLSSTIGVLEKNNISFAGAGDIDNASRPYFFELENTKYGIYCCAEHEFSIVSKNNIGANPFDPLESLDHIASAKRNCEYLIVLYHGGKEHYRYPSPNLQKICRKMIDKGADLVVCQHSHCIGCEERYNNGTIVYGQGNFLFDLRDDSFWKEAVLISLEKNNGEHVIKYIPIIKNGIGVKLADSFNEDRILKEFNNRSEEIKKQGFVEENYIKYCNEYSDYYFLVLSGKNIEGFIFRAINKLLKGHLKSKVIHSYLMKRKHHLINQFECEAHRELIITALKNK